MRICDRWMQEGTTDQRGRSHPPQCTTSLSPLSIRRCLQLSGLSARRPMTHLSATPRCSDSSLKIPWRENAEQLRYAPPQWSVTGYYGIGGIGYHSRALL
ncbi:hypothetical protein TNCV_1965871 [Trichonephila clavipes]|nr:hypothetical protein TNCV_1965871 [Trichonephila clavipes]